MRPTVRADLALRPGYHSPQLDVEVRLNTNEAPLPPPEGFGERVAAAAMTIAWNRYPDRSASQLREAIGIRYRRRSDEVFVANGSNEVLQTVLMTFGGPGRTVAVFEPTYALHAHIARSVGSTVVEGQRGDDFTLDLAEVERVITEHSPSVLFLCSPNNPTGLVDPAETVDTVLGLLAGTGCLLVVDEAYGQFADSSAVGMIDDDVPLVVSRTFSKTWSMAAARLGYLLGPSWLIAELDKTVLPYHLDAMKQAVGLAALDFGTEMDRRVETIVSERQRLMAGFADLPVDIWPSGANFFLFRAAEMSGDELWNALIGRSILVRNCSSWPRLDDCLRVTVGTPAENDRLLRAVGEILARKS